MNLKTSIWKIKKWLLLNVILGEAWRYMNLYPSYITQLFESLGDCSEMKINGKALTFHITGMSIFGVGKLKWIMNNPQLHHIMIVCNDKGLCEFEKNVISQVPNTIIEGDLPPCIMAEKVKNLVDC